MSDSDPAPDIVALTAMLAAQMKSSEERERKMADLFQQTIQRLTQPTQQPVQPSTTSPAPKPVSAERPILLSSSTLADFTAWQEMWRDYYECQHLSAQSRETRVSSLRQALDEELRRFLREGIIVTSPNPDADDVISAVKEYLRRQRNPLLDRIAFYDRCQSKGESFDSFYTSLKELHTSCDFPDVVLCSQCSAHTCSTCRTSLTRVRADTLRDRIVIGIGDDATRHKLLSAKDLTLNDAVTICRAEEAATTTSSSIPSTSQLNAVRRSAYQRSKQQSRQGQPGSKMSEPVLPSAPAPSSGSDTHKKCPNCGRSPHTKSSCPASGKKCNGCGKTGHFLAMCRSSSQSDRNVKHVGQLKLQRTRLAAQPTVRVSTRLATEDEAVTLPWVPDTGSDVDAIGEHHLELLGGFPENLDHDPECVLAASGEQLQNAGSIRASLQVGEVQHSTVIHVYKGLDDALLSRSSLSALQLLPSDWPAQYPAANAAAPPKVRAVSKPVVNPSSADIARVRDELLQEFSDVFSDTGLKAMAGPPMDIQLQPDAKPSCVHTARPIPYAFRDQVKSQLDTMVVDGIIEPVSEPSEWCHPIVLVDKKGTTEKRLTVDFKRLNDQVLRPAHPVRTARDVVSGIGSAQFLTKLDARHGYWQIPLSEQACPMTTFITPYGRYRFLRNPQGLISAGDVFNCRTDAAFDAIPNFAKVVDDCLAYDDDFASHVTHVRDILLCARQHGITLSPSKFTFASRHIHFCGYIVSPDGWVVDDDKAAAIRDFDIPANRTDLRSFLGLVNQCSEFSPHLAACTTPLRGLLKTTREFVWDANHTVAFEKTKSTLLSPPILAFYQHGHDLRLETDASALRGLGFVLWQKQDDKWRIIQCGSRYLSDAESRYAVVELEMLAVVWAVHKCKLYLSGTLFDLITDHRPLIPIINAYSLDQIENPRLLRLRLKLQSFQVHASWRKGSDHAFADALSRNPVGIPSSDDELGEAPALHCRSIRVCMLRDDGPHPNLKFAELRAAASADPVYQSLVQCVLHGFPARQRDLDAPLQPFWNGREHLSVDQGIVMKGQRILVPLAMRQRVLANLHASHQGLVRTKARARQLVYWPGLTADIDTLVRACSACREFQSSQSAEPPMNDRHPTLPFEFVSADLFSCQGYEFLVYVDRLTGWPCVVRTGRTTSSHDVILACRRWFADLGVPAVLCTDGGPQFASKKFADFCSRWQVQRVSSSPHYPQSNGHAEAAVKAMKRLLLKTSSNGNLDTDAFRRGLLEWRNTPGPSGKSPAEHLLGHPLRSFVIAEWTQFDSSWSTVASERAA
ncbi:uncharacterized protein K02A2.6-like [Sycon ciliatum]|uniref:uncharacterized protein K02A2.6-like n=1 Tax=Sycon ciliatum TaxID=27933 RepID=UPI0031F6B6E7